MKRYLLLLSIIAFFTGCMTVKSNRLTGSATNNTVIGGKLFTAVWMENAAEYKALCEQAYNLATLRVNEYLAQNNSSRPKAIVTDIDETFLNNSQYAAHQALQGKDYTTASWNEWTNRAQADTLCGSLAFFKYAASRGVKIFYVTNRSEADRAATLRNLQKFGFPDADSEHLCVSEGSSSKEPRRRRIGENYDILLFLGDNLGDFSDLFDGKTQAERSENVLNNKEAFGKRFIVLPNPDYGDWEDVMYGYKHTLSLQQRDSVFQAKASSYQ